MDDIQHDPSAHRFSIDADGQRGYLDYEGDDGTMVITHTIVPAAIGGRGIAGRLVEAALAYARGQGMKVEARCSYADAWMRKHPDGDALRA